MTRYTMHVEIGLVEMREDANGGFVAWADYQALALCADFKPFAHLFSAKIRDERQKQIDAASKLPFYTGLL